MNKKEQRIKSLVILWGLITLEVSERILYSSTSKHNKMLIESIGRDGVNVSHYVHNEYINTFGVTWDGLPDKMFKEVYKRALEFESIMLKIN